MNVARSMRNLFNKVKRYTGHIDVSVTSKGKLTVNTNPFPCKDCLLQSSCSKPCDKLERDPHKIMDQMMDMKCCIDCGCKRLLEGPCGGASQNVKCAECGHEYNMMLPMMVERIGDFT